MLKIVGFDRYIDLKWLDAIANLWSLSPRQGGPKLEYIRNHMNEMLKEKYPSHESRRKTITVLMRMHFLIKDSC